MGAGLPMRVGAVHTRIGAPSSAAERYVLWAGRSLSSGVAGRHERTASMNSASGPPLPPSMSRASASSSAPTGVTCSSSAQKASTRRPLGRRPMSSQTDTNAAWMPDSPAAVTVTGSSMPARRAVHRPFSVRPSWWRSQRNAGERRITSPTTASQSSATSSTLAAGRPAGGGEPSGSVNIQVEHRTDVTVRDRAQHGGVELGDEAGPDEPHAHVVGHAIMASNAADPRCEQGVAHRGSARPDYSA